jgi:hypothetical protein
MMEGKKLPLQLMRRRLWMERGVFALLIAALAVALFFALRPKTRFVLSADGNPICVVASPEAARYVLAALKRSRAGELHSIAVFHQRIAVEPLREPGPKPLDPLSAQKIAAEELDIVIRAAAIKADGKLIAYARTVREAQQALEAYKRSQVPRKGRLLRPPVFRQEVRIERATMTLEQASRKLPKSQAELLAALNRPTRPRFEHVVARGETALRIARHCKVSLEDLKVANPGLDLDRLEAGEKMAVAGGAPLLTVEASVEYAHREEIPVWVERVPDRALRRGQQKILQEGEPGFQRVRVRAIFVNGREVSRERLWEEVEKEPVPRVVSFGTR